MTRYAKPERIPEHPWQLAEGEWNYLREQVRPNVAQSRPGKGAPAVAIRRAQELDWLLFGLQFPDRRVTWADVMSKAKIYGLV